MSQIETGSTDHSLQQGAAQTPDNQSSTTFFYRQLPYIAVLTLAILGVAYTNASHQPLTGFWEFLALTIGAVCVITQWPKLASREARLKLVGMQALHWLAILVTMNIMLLSGVQQFLPAPATSLVLLMLLALGTFLAGLSLLSLQMCFLGLAMAFAVPAIAWFKQSALFLALGAILLIGLAVTFWPRRRIGERAVSAGEAN